MSNFKRSRSKVWWDSDQNHQPFNHDNRNQNQQPYNNHRKDEFLNHETVNQKTNNQKTLNHKPYNKQDEFMNQETINHKTNNQKINHETINQKTINHQPYSNQEEFLNHGPPPYSQLEEPLYNHKPHNQINQQPHNQINHQPQPSSSAEQEFPEQNFPEPIIALNEDCVNFVHLSPRLNLMRPISPASHRSHDSGFSDSDSSPQIAQPQKIAAKCTKNVRIVDSIDKKAHENIVKTSRLEKNRLDIVLNTNDTDKNIGIVDDSTLKTSRLVKNHLDDDLRKSDCKNVEDYAIKTSRLVENHLDVDLNTIDADKNIGIVDNSTLKTSRSAKNHLDIDFDRKNIDIVQDGSIKTPTVTSTIIDNTKNRPAIVRDDFPVPKPRFLKNRQSNDVSINRRQENIKKAEENDFQEMNKKRPDYLRSVSETLNNNYSNKDKRQQHSYENYQEDYSPNNVKTTLKNFTESHTIEKFAHKRTLSDRFDYENGKLSENSHKINENTCKNEFKNYASLKTIKDGTCIETNDIKVNNSQQVNNIHRLIHKFDQESIKSGNRIETKPVIVETLPKSKSAEQIDYKMDTNKLIVQSDNTLENHKFIKRDLLNDIKDTFRSNNRLKSADETQQIVKDRKTKSIKIDYVDFSQLQYDAIDLSENEDGYTADTSRGSVSPEISSEEISDKISNKDISDKILSQISYENTSNTEANRKISNDKILDCFVSSEISNEDISEKILNKDVSNDKISPEISNGEISNKISNDIISNGEISLSNKESNPNISNLIEQIDVLDFDTTSPAIGDFENHETSLNLTNSPLYKSKIVYGERNELNISIISDEQNLKAKRRIDYDKDEYRTEENNEHDMTQDNKDGSNDYCRENQENIKSNTPDTRNYLEIQDLNFRANVTLPKRSTDTFNQGAIDESYFCKRQKQKLNYSLPVKFPHKTANYSSTLPKNFKPVIIRDSNNVTNVSIDVSYNSIDDYDILQNRVQSNVTIISTDGRFDVPKTVDKTASTPCTQKYNNETYELELPSRTQKSKLRYADADNEIRDENFDNCGPKIPDVNLELSPRCTSTPKWYKPVQKLHTPLSTRKLTMHRRVNLLAGFDEPESSDFNSKNDLIVNQQCTSDENMIKNPENPVENGVKTCDRILADADKNSSIQNCTKQNDHARFTINVLKDRDTREIQEHSRDKNASLNKNDAQKLGIHVKDGKIWLKTNNRILVQNIEDDMKIRSSLRSRNTDSKDIFEEYKENEHSCVQNNYTTKNFNAQKCLNNSVKSNVRRKFNGYFSNLKCPESVQSWFRSLADNCETEAMTALQNKAIRAGSSVNLKTKFELNTPDVLQPLTMLVQQAAGVLSEYENVERTIRGRKSHLCGPLLQSAVGNTVHFLASHPAGRISGKQTTNEQRVLKLCDEIKRAPRPEVSEALTHVERLTRLLRAHVEDLCCVHLEKISDILEQLDYDDYYAPVSSVLGTLSELVSAWGGVLGAAVTRAGLPRALLFALVQENRGNSAEIRRKSPECRARALRVLATVCQTEESVRQFSQAGGIQVILEILQDDLTCTEPERREAAAVLTQITGPWVQMNNCAYESKPDDNSADSDCPNSTEKYDWLRELTTHKIALLKALTDLLTTTKCCQTLLLCAAALANMSRPLMTSSLLSSVTSPRSSSTENLIWCETAHALLRAVKARGPACSVFLQEQTSVLLCNLTSMADCRSRLCPAPTAARSSDALPALFSFHQTAKRILLQNYNNEINHSKTMHTNNVAETKIKTQNHYSNDKTENASPLIIVTPSVASAGRLLRSCSLAIARLCSDRSECSRTAARFGARSYLADSCRLLPRMHELCRADTNDDELVAICTRALDVVSLLVKNVDGDGETQV